MNNNRYLLLNYWINKQIGGTKKRWNTLQHNGVLFPPEYIKHNIPIIYKGNKINLDIESEEIATFYAKYIDSEYVNNKTFNKNFWNDWKKILKKNNNNTIESLEDCDFRLINDYLLKEKEEKQKNKENEIKKRKDIEKKYEIAILDGKEEKVGNFRIEPPGIYIGRGCNPLLGKIKKRIYPEDVIINIGKEAPIPSIPDNLQGHKWKKIIHDKSVIWLASWKDNIKNKIKYVWLSDKSDFKSESDIKKFDMARKLKKKIKKIREQNYINLKSNDIKLSQMATVFYFIDNLALRIGNEKGKNEADTVGVTSLRVEHIKLLDNNIIVLDFYGKDYIRYTNKIKVDEQVYLNIHKFIKDKDKKEQLFDSITSNDINKYLQTFMPNLTAKVFRTYNASNLFQKELNKVSNKYDTYNEEDKINILIDEFNAANAKVALLCNHQKKISKSFNEQIERIDNMIKKLKKQIKKTKKLDRKKKLKKRINELKIKKSLKIELKSVSLGTSKVNYIDPRITFAFAKKQVIDINSSHS